MARSKKSRTGGLIGQRKDPDFKLKREHKPSTVKKGKGQQAGNRQQTELLAPEQASASTTSDKRVGSKKPIKLVRAAVVAATAPVKVKAVVKAKPAIEPKIEEAIVPVVELEELSPEQELAQLEADDRLNELIDRADEGETLSDEEQSWLDGRLQRHQELLEQLGLLEEEEPEIDDDVERGDDELWQDFDQASLDDYKD